MARSDTDNDVLTDMGLGVLGLVAVFGFLAKAAATVTAFLTGNARPQGFGAPWRLIARPGALEAVWGTPVGPVWLFWLIVVVLLALTCAALVGAWMLMRQGRRPGAGKDLYPVKRPETWPGLAKRREVAAAAGPKTLEQRAKVLRPTLVAERGEVELTEVGFELGTGHGVPAWASVEDSVVVVGPPRSGKGLHLAVNAILDAPGAVITTSTRPDNLAPTLLARSAAQDGCDADDSDRPVMVFDPQHLASGLRDALAGAPRWSLIAGCEDPQRAMSRAAVLVGDAGKGVESGSFWSQQCETAVRCLLHAAALGGRSVIELYEWSLSTKAAKKAADVLADHPATASGWARGLSSILDSDPKQRDSVWAMVSNTFAVLADPRVVEAVSPAPGEEFDVEDFLRRSGTVYLLGTASGASATASLVAAFIDDVVETARRLASRSPGFRLDPPLTLILDEAANYPLSGLPALMSEGGGTGISTWVFLQSMAQARSRWGKDDADAIWDAAIVKVILGGGGHADDLSDLSRLMGNRTQVRSSLSYGTRDSSKSWSDSEEEKAVLEVSHIRRIPFGYALLVLRTSAPIMLKLRRWTTRAEADQLTRGREIVETVMSAGPSNTTDTVTAASVTGVRVTDASVSGSAR